MATASDHTDTTPGPAAKDKRRGSLAHRLYVGDIAYEFIGRRKIWYAISAVMLAISLLALGIRGLNLGIEFTGGADFTAPVQVSSTTVGDVRGAVLNSGVKDLDGTTVLTVGKDTVRVETRSLSATEVTTVRQAIAKQVGATDDAKVTYNLIGPSWGQQITTKAVQALVVFLVLVMLLIWAYFRDWKMSIAAIVALIHDLIITVGIYALVGFSVTPATLIGVLTILGYSLYDTVVVFDKVRENVHDLAKGNRTYSQAANDAVNQVLVRSLNTTLIGVLPVAAILFAGSVVLGSGPLEDLGLALFVGMISGAYSSIFIATPLLAQFKEREPAMKQLRATIERRATKSQRKSGAPVSVAPAAATSSGASVSLVGASQMGTSADSAANQAAAGETGSTNRRQPTRSTRSQRKN